MTSLARYVPLREFAMNMRTKVDSSGDTEWLYTLVCARCLHEITVSALPSERPKRGTCGDCGGEMLLAKP